MRPPLLGANGSDGPGALAALLGVIFAGVAGVLGGVAALVAALRKPPAPAPVELGGFVPDAATIFLDITTKLEAANEERDQLLVEVAELEAELDARQRRLDQCNEERLRLLRQRREAAGSSPVSPSPPPASSSPPS